MLTRLAQSPKAVTAVQRDKQIEPKEYTIQELADRLTNCLNRKITYSQVRAFIMRHNKNNPEAKITPVTRAATGKKIFIKPLDAAIIREEYLHPENSERPAWEDK